MNYLKMHLLATLMFLTMVTSHQLRAENTYFPTAKLVGKFGTSRSIAQIGAVLPLLQKENSLIYIPIIGMIDVHNANEINIGLGTRKIINKKYILGGYGFFDYRKSQYGHFFKQITLGFEFFTKNFEFRTNVYLPEQKTRISHSENFKSVSVHYDGSHTHYTFSNNHHIYKYTPNYGGDTEIGTSLGKKSYIYLAYYHFFNKNNKNITDGIRLRSTYRQSSLLTFEAEVSYHDMRRDTYDKMEKFKGFIGFSLNFSKKHQHNSLLRKMTQLPVRDVDIIVDREVSTSVDSSETRKNLGFVPLVDLEMYTESGLGGSAYSFFRHYYKSDTDPINDNVVSLQNALVGLGTERYVVTNFSMDKHATALIVDRQSNVIYFMDSNHGKLSDRQKDILQQSFGSGYSYNSNLVTPMQRESWSCAQHTFQNIIDFFDGSIQRGSAGSNRDMTQVLRNNLYLHAASYVYTH